MVPAAVHSGDAAAPAVDRRESRTELDGVVGASGLLVFAGLFTVLGNVGFQTLVARSGDVANYGVASGLFAAAGAAVFLAAGLQYAVGRVASLNEASGPALLRRAVPGLYPWLVVSGVVAAASPLEADYLHLSSALPVALTVAYSLLMVAAGLPAGVLIGRRRFRSYAVSVCASVVIRILAGALFAAAMPGVNGALVASIVGAAAFVGALVLSTSRATPLPDLADMPAKQAKVRFGDSVPGSVLAGLLWLQWTFPLIAARHLLPAGVVGDFGAANLFAGGIIMLAGPLTTVLFPSLVRSTGQRVFAVGLAATTALSVLLGAGLVALGPITIHLVYGGKYRVGALTLALLALSATATAVWTYLLWVLRARGSSLRGVVLVAVTAIAVEIVLSFVPPLQSTRWLAVLPGIGLLIGSLANVGRHALRLKSAPTRERPLRVQVQDRDDIVTLESPGSLLPQVAVGMMVYNEEATLEECMRAVLDERDRDGKVRRLVVVSSGTTDSSESIVRRLAAEDDRVVLISHPERQGKVAAINEFLSCTVEPICALVNADTLLAPGSLTRLVEPLRDPAVGMVGGRVVPVNSASSLPGRMVRLLWNLHHEISTTSPKLGEVVVFRNCFDRLESIDAADEVALEFQVTKAGALLRYVPDAVVYNYGAASIGDLYRHRKRIHHQHLGFKNRTRYAPSTMRWTSSAAAIARTILDDPEETWAAFALVGVELASRASANIARRFNPDEVKAWDPIDSAKQPFTSEVPCFADDMEDGQRSPSCPPSSILDAQGEAQPTTHR
jgi:biofilm PGA synthesis N-glycosyltransferase PgaC